MTEVIKDTFETRMKIREFDTDIRKLKERVDEIEKKQAERYPHLIKRIDRIEGSFPAIVDRIDRARLDLVQLKDKICKLTKRVCSTKMTN